MSYLLDRAAKQDEQRKSDLDRNDALEKELIAADLAYLDGRQQRDAENLRIAHQMDLDAMRRAGW